MKRTSDFISLNRGGPKSSVASSLTSCLASRLAIVAALILLPLSTQAATFFVTETNDSVDFDPGDGECRGFVPLIFEGACTLRAAVMEANELPGPDVIILPTNETFVLFIDGEGNGNSAAHGDLDIFDEVFIGTAEFGAPEFVAESEADYPLIDGSGTGDRIFDLHADAGSVTFARMRMAFGDATTTEPSGNGRGGAINIRESVGEVLIDRVDIHSNIALRGGAIFNRGDNQVTIADSLIHDNTAVDAGAALVNDCGDMRVERTSIYDNLVPDNEFLNAEAILNEQDLVENNGNCALTIANSSILNNGPVGVYSTGDVDLSLANVTLSGHDAIGVSIFAFESENSSLRMRNTVSAGQPRNCQLAGNGTVDLDVNGYNSADDANDSCQLTPTADGSTNVAVIDALLSGPQDDPLSWHRINPPSAESGLIDRGHPEVDGAGCDPFDQRGVDRPRDGDNDGEARCDIGAVELLREVLFSNGFEDLN